MGGEQRHRYQEECRLCGLCPGHRLLQSAQSAPVWVLGWAGVVPPMGDFLGFFQESSARHGPGAAAGRRLTGVRRWSTTARDGPRRAFAADHRLHRIDWGDCRSALCQTGGGGAAGGGGGVSAAVGAGAGRGGGGTAVGVVSRLLRAGADDGGAAVPRRLDPGGEAAPPAGADRARAGVRPNGRSGRARSRRSSSGARTRSAPRLPRASS